VHRVLCLVIVVQLPPRSSDSRHIQTDKKSKRDGMRVKRKSEGKERRGGKGGGGGGGGGREGGGGGEGRGGREGGRE